MNQNHDLKDICTEVNRALDSPMVDIIRSGSVELLGLINPAIGTVAAIGNNILSKLNTFKLSLLLNGLESDLDIEKRLNELYIYVSSSPENAITVANLLQKTIYSECPKVCVVYGLVLANHLTPPSKLTHEEMIVCKALENATDHDLKNFKEIMKSYMERKSNGNRVVFPPGLIDPTTN